MWSIFKFLSLQESSVHTEPQVQGFPSSWVLGCPHTEDIWKSSIVPAALAVNRCGDSCCSVTTLARYGCYLAADHIHQPRACRLLNEPRLRPPHTSLFCSCDWQDKCRFVNGKDGKLLGIVITAPVTRIQDVTVSLKLAVCSRTVGPHAPHGYIFLTYCSCKQGSVWQLSLDFRLKIYIFKDKWPHFSV